MLHLNSNHPPIIGNETEIRQIVLPALFVSDIHIRNSNDECLQQLKRLVARINPPTLILLGDIFDAWVGWDADAELERKWKNWISSQQTSRTILFMPGNRDQLLQRTSDLHSMVLLPDPCIVQVGSERWLLTHGDRYCVQDRLHLIWMRIQQKSAFLFLQLPLKARLYIRSLILKQSKRHKRYLPLDKQQIPPEQWHKLRHEHMLDMIVHGHTHRPQYQRSGATQWITLGDWGPSPSYLYVEKPQRWTLCFSKAKPQRPPHPSTTQ